MQVQEQIMASLKKGFEKGKAEGLEDGKKPGLDQGIAQGQSQVIAEILRQYHLGRLILIDTDGKKISMVPEKK